MTTGFLGSMTISPSIDSLARPARRANSPAARRCGSAGLPASCTAMSRPDAVAVTVILKVSDVVETSRASRLSAGKAATISGSAIGHS
jgi:hypothetical protein